MNERFVRKAYRAMLIMEDAPKPLLDRFAGYQAPQVKKRIGPGET